MQLMTNDSAQTPPFENRKSEYSPPEDPIFVFEVEFSGDEVERLGRMLRADDGPIVNDYLRDLALEAIRSWERKQPAAVAD